MILLDNLLPHFHMGSEKPERIECLAKKTTLLMLAVTLHNIPEGMAVGLTFAMLAQQNTTIALSGAVALAIGIGIQNFPEGQLDFFAFKK